MRVCAIAQGGGVRITTAFSFSLSFAMVLLSLEISVAGGGVGRTTVEAAGRVEEAGEGLAGGVQSSRFFPFFKASVISARENHRASSSSFSTKKKKRRKREVRNYFSSRNSGRVAQLTVHFFIYIWNQIIPFKLILWLPWNLEGVMHPIAHHLQQQMPTSVRHVNVAVIVVCFRITSLSHLVDRRSRSRSSVLNDNARPSRKLQIILYVNLIMHRWLPNTSLSSLTSFEMPRCWILFHSHCHQVKRWLRISIWHWKRWIAAIWRHTFCRFSRMGRKQRQKGPDYKWRARIWTNDRKEHFGTSTCEV